ncbi:MAG TPA: substrate-binding domain-containing protein [bacterium]|nr:substrate-binding domain-containing protein [bacterium]
MGRLLGSLLVVSLLVSLGLAPVMAENPPPPAKSQAPVKNLEGTVSVSGAWALYPMTVKWAEEFQKIYPKVKIDVSAGGAGKGMADALAGVVDIGMVSRAVYPAEIEKGAWWIAVTKDAVVPTINAKNPFLKDLAAKGVKHDAFVDIWITDKVKTWGDVLGTTAKEPVHVYTRSDACGAADTWAGYMGKKQDDLHGVGVYGDPGLTEAVKKDNLGIGYNNIGYAYDGKTKKPLDGIAILPIDVNGNGVIDKEENCYATRDDIVKAIDEGRYPSPPARDLHFVTKGNPTREVVREFMKWVLTDGQKFVPDAGYINLTPAKLKAQMDKLEGKVEATPETKPQAKPETKTGNTAPAKPQGSQSGK